MALDIDTDDDQKEWMYVQSGLVLSGLAITIPELAPEAQAPAAPILHSRSFNAIGLSVAMNESTERFMISASRCLTRLGSGRAKTTCKARLPIARKELKEYMMGYATVEVRLKLLKGMREEKDEARQSMAILYQDALQDSNEHLKPAPQNPA